MKPGRVLDAECARVYAPRTERDIWLVWSLDIFYSNKVLITCGQVKLHQLEGLGIQCSRRMEIWN